MFKNTDLTKVLITLIGAVVVIVVVLTFTSVVKGRQKNGSLTIEAGDRKVEMAFTDNKVDFIELIKVLMEDQDNKTNTLAILRDSYGLYEKDSPLLIDAIRKRQGGDDFSKGLRELLANLSGPFQREYHYFYDITVHEVVEAINRLDYDHVVSKEFRKQCDSRKGIFHTEPIPIYLIVSDSNQISDEEAAVCEASGGDFFRLHLLVAYKSNPPLHLFANRYFYNMTGGDKPCVMINSTNGKKLIGQDAKVGIRYEAMLYPTPKGYQIAPLIPPIAMNASAKESL